MGNGLSFNEISVANNVFCQQKNIASQNKQRENFLFIFVRFQKIGALEHNLLIIKIFQNIDFKFRIELKIENY